MSTEYHKIHSIWKRTPNGTMIPWDWSRPELGYLADLEWEWTEKVDGTNIRIGLDTDRTYFVGGRTDAAQIPATLLAAIDALNLRDLLPAAFHDGPVTLYGEGYGAKIQKGGGNYRPDQGFVLFDVKVGPWWLLPADVADVATTLGLDIAPVVGRGSLRDAIDRVSGGLRSRWGDFEAEGIVCRPVVPLSDRRGNRLICKVKGIDFAKMARDGVKW